jgi:putative glutamine amidotransferase
MCCLAVVKITVAVNTPPGTMQKRNYKIGLTYTGSPEKHADYVAWLMDNTHPIEVIQLDADQQNQALVKELDGIVIAGGIDAHPAIYGSSNLYYPQAPATFNSQRDAFETEVVQEAIYHHKPLLGICRGMQLINCILGGTLRQDLGTAGNGIHQKQEQDKQHPVTIIAPSLLSEVLSGTTQMANSAHHQCVEVLADTLQLNAISDDDVAEGLEWKDKTGKNFLLGVQWHPERMYKLGMQNLPLCIAVKKLFLSAVIPA